MLRGHIKITKKEETRVDGRPVFEDVVIRECVADIQDLYGIELYQAMQTELQDTVIFKIRYCRDMEKLRTNKQDYRVIYNGIIYNIYQVDVAKYPRRDVVIKCQIKH